MRATLTVFTIALVFMAQTAWAKCDPGETVIRFGIPISEGDDTRLRAVKLMETMLNRDLQGKACLQILSDKSQYEGALAVTALTNRSIDMAAPAFDALSRFQPAYRLYDLPFAFRDERALDRFWSSQAGREVRGQLKANGVEPLAEILDGFHQISAKLPVTLPLHMRGLKFRSTGNRGEGSMLSALGAIPQTVAMTELAERIKSGQIEGFAAPWTGFDSAAQETLSAGVTEANFRVSGYEIIVASPWWEGLDVSLKKQIADSVARVARQANFDTQRRMVAAKRSLIRKGVPVLTLTHRQRRQWRAALERVWQSYQEATPPSVLEALRVANSGL